MSNESGETKENKKKDMSTYGMSNESGEPKEKKKEMRSDAMSNGSEESRVASSLTESQLA